MDRTMNPVDHHNAALPEITQSIIKPIVMNGGGKAEILVLTESVLAAIALYCASNNAREAQNYLDVLHRWALQRLTQIERQR